jgi:hypothetical protein
VNGTAGAGDLTSAELQTAGAKIVNEIQLGNFSQIINVSQDTTYSIAEAPPTPGSTEWSEIKTDDSPYTPLYIVDAMKFQPALVPQHEGVPFATQPKVQIVDKNVSLCFVSMRVQSMPLTLHFLILNNQFTRFDEVQFLPLRIEVTNFEITCIELSFTLNLK